MRIAVVGAGISGLATAWLLGRDHAVTLFEAGDYLGGHSNTVDVTLDGHTCPVDTGFLVFNDRTYPNLVAMFDALGVRSHASDMSLRCRWTKGGSNGPAAI
jgi:predicted NAD/FAD-binding protein